VIGYTDAGLSRIVYVDFVAGAYTTRTELREDVKRAWLADGGYGTITETAWLELFAAAAFPKPDQPVRLYRGASPERRNGWSWTPSVEMARAYARSRCPIQTMGAAFPVPPRPVWTLLAPPESVLGSWPTPTVPVVPDPPMEFVVRTDGLDIELAR